MRHSLSTARISIIAGSALFVAACGGTATVADENVANDVESNMLFDAPGNDASALESVAPIDTAPPVANLGEDEVLGETSGGDTGGNTVDNDVAGM